MSYESEQKLRTMRRWLAYSEQDFEKMDPMRRDEYLNDGVNMCVEVLKSLHADTLKLRERAESRGPILVP